jgi:simple sugar transport system permease protein
VSDTTARSREALGPPGSPDGGRGGPGALRGALGVLARQREATVFLVALALLLYFGISYPSTFVSQSNGVNLLSETAAPIILIAIGEVLLLICGEIDLSVGFIYQFSPFLMYFLIAYYHVPALLAIILALVMGLVVGWVNGFLTVTLGLPSFITTLGTGFVLNGIVLTTSHAYPVNIPKTAATLGKYIGSDSWSQIIWALALAAIFYVVLNRTRWGLHTIATGGNLLGAQEAGINVARVKYGNFMITGVLGSLVGMQVAFYTNTIDPTAGGYNPMFLGVTAAVIGGTAMLGGQGTVIGAVLGAIVIATITDGFNIAGISANPQPIIYGGAILIAMIANVRLARLRAAGRNL